MTARVETYGGEENEFSYRTVQHWQLVVDGFFVADTSAPQHAEMFERIAEAWNAQHPANVYGDAW